MEGLALVGRPAEGCHVLVQGEDALPLTGAQRDAQAGHGVDGVDQVIEDLVLQQVAERKVGNEFTVRREVGLDRLLFRHGSVTLP